MEGVGVSYWGSSFKFVSPYQIPKGKGIDKEIRFDQIDYWTISTASDYSSNADWAYLMPSISIQHSAQDCARTSLVGIDKLVLTSRDFSLPTTPSMVLQTNTEIGSEAPILAITKDGKELRGQKLYKRTKDLETCTNVSINRFGLTVSLNPNKQRHDYWTYSDPVKLKESLIDIEKELKSIGIRTNIGSMLVSRIDLNKDNQMEHPYKNYQPIFESLNAKKKRITPHTSGVSIGNKSSSFVFYNKHQQMKDTHKIDIGVYNLLRGELQIQTRRKVKTSTYFDKVENLIKYYDHKDSIYTREAKIVLNSINNCNIDQISLPFENDITALMATCQKTTSKKLVHHLAAIGGLDYIYQKFGCLESYKVKVIDQLSIHHQQKTRLKKELDDIGSTYGHLSNMYQKRQGEISTMMNEIYQKFAA